MRWNRSCVACKRRKIKCNRNTPCGYCQKLDLNCEYLDTAPRTSRAAKRADQGHTSHVQALERRVKELEQWRASAEHHDGHQGVTPRTDRSATATSLGQETWISGSSVLPSAVNNPDSQSAILATGDHEPSPCGTWGLGWNVAQELKQLHPAGPNILALWQVYKESVDPLLNILHVPTVNASVSGALAEPSKAALDVQALLFAIYFAAGTSMRYTVSSDTLPFIERRQKFVQYESGLQQALARGKFMVRPSLMSLQAMTIYLTCAQYHGKTALLWSMIGLLIRLAMKLDLNRESGPQFDADVEQKRRLWWAVVMLDADIAQKSETTPLICEHMFEVQLPQGIEVQRQQPATHRLAPLACDPSDLLFTQCRLDITQLTRALLGARFGQPNASVVDDYGALDDLMVKLEKRCLLDTPSAKLINLFTATACRIMIARVKLVKIKRRDAHTDASPEEQDACRVLQDTIVELYVSVKANSRFKRWAWILDVDGIPEFVELANV